MDENFDFKSQTDKMILAMGFIASIDVSGIIDAVENAHIIGPFVDPTKYRDALQRGDIDSVSRLAHSLQEPIKLFNEMKDKKLESGKS